MASYENFHTQYLSDQELSRSATEASHNLLAGLSIKEQLGFLRGPRSRVAADVDGLNTEGANRQFINFGNSSDIYASSDDPVGDSLGQHRAHSVGTDDGASAVDTQREQQEMSHRTTLKVGIDLEPHEGEMPIEHFGRLGIEQKTQVLMIGASAFAAEMNDESWQVAHGIHDGTQSVAVGLFNTAASAVNVALDIASAPQRLGEWQTRLAINPVSACTEAIPIASKVITGVTDQIRVVRDASAVINDYAFNALIGKVQPLSDVMSYSNHAVSQECDAYERWDAQSTYQKTVDATELCWASASPELLETTTTAATVGASEMSGGLQQIAARYDALLAKMDQTVKKYKPEALKTSDMKMPEVPSELAHLELTKATPELLRAIESKGREICVASPGSEELRYLQSQRVEASTGRSDLLHILLKEDAPKIAALEEFLHRTQKNIGVIDNAGREVAEVRVKDFMIRHAKMLGLDDNDVAVLKALRKQEADHALARGIPARMFRVGEHE